MNWKRMGRFLVCLALVAVLLINCSPIKAKAITAEAMVLVSGSILITSALIGIGIGIGENVAAFLEVVEDIKSSDAMKDFLNADGNVAIQRFSTSGGDLSAWMVPLVFLEAVRMALVECEILRDGGESANGVPDERFDNDVYYGNYLLPEFVPSSDYPYFVVFVSGSSFWVQDFSALVTLRDGDFYADVSMTTHLYSRDVFADGTTAWSYYSTSNWSKGSIINFASFDRSAIYANFPLCDADGNVLQSFPEPTQSLLSTDYDLTLFDVAPLDQELAAGYPTWSGGAIADDTEAYWYPIGLGQTLDETLGLTQEQVQAGEGTFEATDSDAGTADDTVTASGLKGWIDSFKDNVSMWFARVSLHVSNTYDTVVQGFADVGAGIASIPDAIVSGVTSALEAIFVPSEDFLTAKVDALRAEFAFADTIITGGQMIGDAFNGFDAEPPIIYIDLGATRGDYDIGGKVPFIDLTWYEEYKPTVDMLLSSFLWVVFIWKLFQKAPGIISGMPGDFVMEGLQQLNLDVYLPARKESHEKVRRLNRRSKL